MRCLSLGCRRLGVLGGVLASTLLVPAQARATNEDIRLCSVGFPTDRPKVATTLGGQSFQLIDADTETVVYEGATTTPALDARTNQVVSLADFSAFTTPGNYYLLVPDVGQTREFRIGEDVWDFEFQTAMLGFYGWRSGTDVRFSHRDQEYSHQAGHLNDAYLDFLGQPGVIRDGTHGWYDAGDYGKYTVNGAFALGMMLSAWEDFGDRIRTVKLQIPESGGELPDYLAEIRFEYDWLLSMQYGPKDGRVSHKLTALEFEGFMLPKDDHSLRYFSPYGSAATADFVAAMAQGARVYEAFDSELSDGMLAAAELGYAWLEENLEDVPADISAFGTGDYQAADIDSRLWAAAELWETTGDPSALADFEQRALARNELVDLDFDWGSVGNLGVFTYLRSQRDNRDPEVVRQLEEAVLQSADQLVTSRDASGYARAVDNYYWGSNGSVARSCMLLQAAQRLAPEGRYVDVCAEQVGYLYGRNFYNRSQVTGEGHRPPRHPHHRLSASDDVRGPYPGLLVGGGWTATDWVDSTGNYERNEVAVNWNAALIYALAGFITGNTAEDPGPSQDPGNLNDPFSGNTSGPPSLIDDFEDGDTAILASEGRVGDWYTSDDGSGETTGYVNLEDARAESTRAMHVSGSAYSEWGGGIGFTLNETPDAMLTYDARTYTGISFYARSGGGTEETFHVSISDLNTNPEGGICSRCFDDFGTDFDVTADYQKFTFAWEDLAQRGWGAPNTGVVAPEALYSIQVGWFRDQTFDLYLDDIAFTTAEIEEEEGSGGAEGEANAVLQPHLDELALPLSPRGGCELAPVSTASEPWAAASLATALLVFTRRRQRVAVRRGVSSGLLA